MSKKVHSSVRPIGMSMQPHKHKKHKVDHGKGEMEVKRHHLTHHEEVEGGKHSHMHRKHHKAK